MGTDPIRTLSAINRCLEANWLKSVLEGGLMTYEFKNDKVLHFQKKTAQVEMRARGAKVASQSDHWSPISFVYR